MYIQCLFMQYGYIYHTKHSQLVDTAQSTVTFLITEKLHKSKVLNATTIYFV